MSSDSSSTASNVRLGLIILALAGVLAAIAFAVLNERGDDAVVVRFEDQEFTAAELHDILETLPDGIPASVQNGSIGKAIPSQVMTQWIQFAALRAQFADEGYVANEQDAANALTTMVNDPTFDPNSAFGEFLISLQAEIEVANRYAADSVDPGPIEPPEYLCSSHILLNSEEDALDVITLLDDGRDFAELAMEFSTGPSGPNGGDLGCAPTSGYVAEYSDGARATGVGVSAPVQSAFGFHVIQVRSIGPLSADVHPEMDPADIDARLDAERSAAVDAASGSFRQEFEIAALARLEGDADLWVDPRYGFWDEANRSILPIGG